MLISRLTHETSLQKGFVSSGFSTLTYFFNNTISPLPSWLKSTSFILPVFMILSAVFGGDHMVRVSICCTAVNTDQPGSARAAGSLWFKKTRPKTESVMRWGDVCTLNRNLSHWLALLQRSRRTECPKSAMHARSKLSNMWRGETNTPACTLCWMCHSF